MDKVKVFKTELDWIVNPDVRAFAEKCIEATPDYFYSVPASSTGKYHPEYSLGDGGLIRHTKAVCYFAHELLSLEHNKARFTELERDRIMAAAILHDSYKYGDVKGKYTIANHAAFAASKINPKGNESDISSHVSALVLTHMGEWNADKDGNELAPKPITDAQKFLHECDFLASRKPINIDFGDNYYAGLSVIDLREQIVKLCKERLSTSKNKDNLRAYLYDIIGALNGGEKNPLKIMELAAAKRTLEAIEQYGTDEKASEGTAGFGVIFADIG